MVKRKWAILEKGSEYDREVQARTVYAIAVLYNMIRTWEYGDEELELDARIPSDTAIRRGLGQAYHTESRRTEGTRVTIQTAETRSAQARREDIQERMWTHYQEVLEQRRQH